MKMPRTMIPLHGNEAALLQVASSRMPQVVLRSINDPTEQFCVDIIKNDTGLCCYKFFRRDLEDNCWWFPFGPESGFSFRTPEAALAAASLEIVWLDTGAN